jgi:Protein of unknown function DUF262/Protein of unknown function (DUF1524)
LYSQSAASEFQQHNFMFNFNRPDSYIREAEFTRVPQANATIRLKSINQLLVDDNGNPARYWIPAYQRGYRWTKTQVTQLLDDIWEFIQGDGSKTNNAFYCLQPLVIRRRTDGSYEVVDGQQRLTTIFILLSHRQDILRIIGKQRYNIAFAMKDPAFLIDINVERADENADFYHICEAWKAIDAWCHNRDGSHVLKLVQHLLNDDEAGPNVRVIWYELATGDNPVAAFTRLNVGKIPLTEAELIRALFLRRAMQDDPNGNLSLRIAYEWDQVEKRLQDDAVWYFLQNEDPCGTNRIGLIFRLAAHLAEKNNGGVHDGQPYSVFFHFLDRLKGPVPVADDEWRRVREIFLSLEEWYEDRELFHIIGYVLQQDNHSILATITDMLAQSRELPKHAFARALRDRVFAPLVKKSLDEMAPGDLKEEISELCGRVAYANGSARVRSLLLLFNLATLLDDPRSNVRFQFESFKRERWDIEHIRSVSDSRPDKIHEQDEWLRHCLAYFEATDSQDKQDFINRIETYLAVRGGRKKESTESFEEIDGALLAHFGENNVEPEHGLGNLTLLDSRTNRSYKNAAFAVKRKTLLGHDRSGIFVPLCTRNVFLKAYSRAVGNPVLWSSEDAKAYLHQIGETLARFFNKMDSTGQ